MPAKDLTFLNENVALKVMNSNQSNMKYILRENYFQENQAALEKWLKLLKVPYS